jgi:hypothetical protein
MAVKRSFVKFLLRNRAMQVVAQWWGRQRDQDLMQIRARQQYEELRRWERNVARLDGMVTSSNDPDLYMGPLHDAERQGFPSQAQAADQARQRQQAEEESRQRSVREQQQWLDDQRRRL